MTCTISNRARRSVSFRGNSGQTFHLAPGLSIDLAGVEVTDNPKIGKLTRQGVITIVEDQSADAATTRPEKPQKSKSRAAER